MTASNLSLGSFFKFCYAASLAVLLPLFLVFGVLALGGADTVRMNGTPVHGPQALIIALVMPFLMSLLLAACLSLGALVLRLFSTRGPRLRFKSDVTAEAGPPKDA